MHNFIMGLLSGIFLISSMLSSIACPGHLTATQAEQSMTKRYSGQTLWLKQSLYAGHFYDDTHKRLADTVALENLEFLSDLEGRPIYPPKADEIIEVGTEIFIEKIEWPNDFVQFKRPMRSPRKYPWLYFKAKLTRGQTSFMRDKIYIIVAPTIQEKNDAAFKTWFDSLFASQNTNFWFLAQSKEVQEAIRQKEVVNGMTPDQVRASLGNPSHLTRQVIEEEGKTYTEEIATYGKREVRFLNGQAVNG